MKHEEQKETRLLPDDRLHVSSHTLTQPHSSAYSRADNIKLLIIF